MKYFLFPNTLLPGHPILEAVAEKQSVSAGMNPCATKLSASSNVVQGFSPATAAVTVKASKQTDGTIPKLYGLCTFFLTRSVRDWMKGIKNVLSPASVCGVCSV